MTQSIQSLTTIAQWRDSKTLGSSHPDAGPSFRQELTAATKDAHGAQDVSLDEKAIVRRFNENGFFAEIAPMLTPSGQRDSPPVVAPAATATERARPKKCAELTLRPADSLQTVTPVAIGGAPSLPVDTVVPGRALPPVFARGNRANPPSLLLKVQVAAARPQEGTPVEGAPLSRPGLKPPHAGKSSDFQLLLFMREGIAEVVGRLASLDEVEHARLLEAIDALFSDHGVRAHRVIFNGAGKPPLALAKGN